MSEFPPIYAFFHHQSASSHPLSALLGVCLRAQLSCSHDCLSNCSPDISIHISRIFQTYIQNEMLDLSRHVSEMK